MYRRHAFLAAPARAAQLAVRALDPDVDDAVTQRERWYVSYLDAMEV